MKKTTCLPLSLAIAWPFPEPFLGPSPGVVGDSASGGKGEAPPTALALALASG